MSSVLITGGDGYLGRQVVERYLAGSDADVILAVRASGPEELAAKSAALADLGKRVSVIPGDLADPRPFAGVDTGSITSVVHSAAITRFNVTEEDARRVNLEGTLKVLDFAARCPQLERISILSTLYATGLASGPISEVATNGAGEFANFYEWSKHECERVVLEQYGGLPWQMLRVATVISHDQSGTVRQFNAFHNTLKLYFYGMLSLLPGSPTTPLYFVDGQFAADAVFSLATSGEGGVFHISHPYESAPTLQQLIDVAFDRFECDESFRRRRVLRPVYADRDAFAIFSDGVGAFASSAVTQAVASVTPFAPQLYVHKEINTDRLSAALGNTTPALATDLVRTTCDWLARTRWGRNSDAE
jgi:nucleoside-diphosphate-sugar epimerase